MNDNPISYPGLTDEEAARRLQQVGLNTIPEQKRNPWLEFLKKFWGPIPWMLEVTVILELILHRFDDAIIMIVLIIFNAILSTLQEQRASNALAILRQQLKISARVKRNGEWKTIPAEEVVPDDVIHIRMGDILPADVRLLEGNVLVDQSALTGESLPVEIGANQECYTGGIVQKGEATALVLATGIHTRFGKTANLVRAAKSKSNLESVIFSVTRALIILDVILAFIVLGYTWITHQSLLHILPFTLILLVASVPVALPATFTIATALGAKELTHQGVLVTNLTAIEEAAGMDILCSDKTGTITENKLSVSELTAYAPYSDQQLLHFASMASDPSTQDALDLAIIERAKQEGVLADYTQRKQFSPFDPATKRSEAIFSENEQSVRVTKGAPHTIAPLCNRIPANLENDMTRLAALGYRILAVAAGDETNLQLCGLVSLQDPPRSDSKSLIQHLQNLGIRVVMVSGDSLPTAKAVSQQVGIGEKACLAQSLHENQDIDPQCDVFAEVLPEDKFQLVQTYQKHNHIVGMIGDGVNDAPALRQAQVGIAVSTATDVAKAAASLVLTQPGLSNIVSAITVSRQIYQRMLTYVLNKIIKTIQIASFLSLGYLITHAMVTRPFLVVLLLFANDFVTMSIATDSVQASPKPDRWDVRAMLFPAIGLAVPVLVLTFGIFIIARDLFHFSLVQLQTLAFLTLVFTGQGMVYLVRERGHFWKSMPGKWMMVASTIDIIVVILLATLGIFMNSVPLSVAGLTLIIVVLFLFGLDYLKVWVFRVAHLHG